MKKIIFIVTIAFFGILITSSLLTAQEAVFKITGLEGKVLVMIKPSAEWVEAQVGQELKEGDGIKTLADGKAHLRLNDKTGFLVSPSSEIYIELPLVAEPYEEAVPVAPIPVYAPNNATEEQASKT